MNRLIPMHRHANQLSATCIRTSSLIASRLPPSHSPAQLLLTRLFACNRGRTGQSRRPMPRKSRSNKSARDSSPHSIENPDANGVCGRMLDRGQMKEFKLCLVCQLPMVKRAKWTRCWADVQCCSDKCKRIKRSAEFKSNHNATTDEAAVASFADQSIASQSTAAAAKQVNPNKRTQASPLTTVKQ